MSTKLRSHGKSMVVWVLLAMLILGLGGFGVRNFSGGIQSIGAVGDTEVTVNDYARALRSEMNAAQAQIGRALTKDEALSLGLDRAVQGQLFGEAAMTEAARKLNLSVGDGEVGKQITAAKGFQGIDGKFDRETYKLAIRQEGYTEAQFEARLRADIARSILQGAVAGGVTAPATLVDTYAAYLGESRDLAFAEITEADLTTAIGTPDEAALQTWYDDHIDAFTKPEAREIYYVSLTPDMLKDKVSIDEATLKATYEDRLAEYVQPERRRVDKLVYPTTEEAAAAKAKFEAGASFADLASERGLTLADTDLGEMSKDELGAAGEAVFALAAPGIAGPIDTDLGPALFQMNGVVPGESTSFEEARTDIEAELAMDRARRMIGDMTTDLEDRLASGATLEDMANETDMEAGKISMVPGASEGIAAYENFRTTAEKVTAEDFPELGNLEDGGVFALRLDGITPAAPLPFAEVKDQVLESWRAAELARLKVERAGQVVAAVAEGKSLGAQGLLVTQAAAVARGAFLEGLPKGGNEAAFATEAGKAVVVSEGDLVAVVEVRSVTNADTASAELQSLKTSLETGLAQSLANDMLDLYARAAQNEAGLSLDSTAINAVQAQLQ